MKACHCGAGLAVALLLATLPPPADAAERCEPWAAKIVSVEGTIEAQPAQQTAWHPAAIGDTYCPGDKLRVPQWRASIVLANDTIIRLDEGTTITLTRFETDRPMWLDLLDGIVHFLSRVPQRLNITTPFVNASVEGTEFVIRVDRDETRIWVFEGLVKLTNGFGELALGRNQAAAARAGEAPQRVIIVRPRDAVQWALYYPPVIDYQVMQVTGPGASAIQQALDRFRQGDVLGALESLEGVPPGIRDARFFALRAGMLLSVGRLERAQADIQAALERDPVHGIATALQAVIAVVRTEKDRALELAQQAATRVPDSPVPQLALSYAYQAAFQLELALEHAQKATKLAPDDSLAWARVAELWLALGYLDDAEEAAQKAVARNPDLARTQTILGFAQLRELSFVKLDRDKAMHTFLKAIQLDQSDPLPRLGLGLTKIHQGKISEGRRDLEIAASLDPNNALVRSYLGKAYYEERRNKLSADQLQAAKTLDPQDPTPWFYDAIRKQTVNRPIDALHDLQKSIELNDNRAVYRSQLFLDQDFAARSASVGRIYKDLNFEQRALVEGWNSLTVDPTSYSSHRLLADSYANISRVQFAGFQVARASELLQSQLLQPLNINNLQAELSQTSLQILEGAGPSDLAFNEFNPFFMYDHGRVLFNGVAGNNETYGYDIIGTAIEGPLSVSAAGFQYWSDGFRSNNDLHHTIFNVFSQAMVSSNLNIQGEFRHRETDQGDLTLNFDPDAFRENQRLGTDQDTGRFGVRFTPAPHSDVLFSFIYTDRLGTIDDMPAPGVDIDIATKSKGYQLEGQYIYRHKYFNAIAGGGSYDVDVDMTSQIQFSFCPIPVPPMVPCPVPLSAETLDDFNRDDQNAYLYINTLWPRDINWTVGLAYEDFEDRETEIERVLPKAGFQWNVTDWARLRLGYMQTVKRALVVQQTIEPTQVAGFNQLFDDFNGTWSQRYGAAVDFTLTEDLYGGVWYGKRDLVVPSFQVGGDTFYFDREEDFYIGYLYWTPHPYWAANTQFIYDRFKQEGGFAMRTGQPTKIQTITIPNTIRFFHPSGWFAGIRGTFVRQDLTLLPSSSIPDDLDNFFLTDASLGYRLASISTKLELTRHHKPTSTKAS